MKVKSAKAFSLVELLIVIVILSILVQLPYRILPNTGEY